MLDFGLRLFIGLFVVWHNVASRKIQKSFYSNDSTMNIPTSLSGGNRRRNLPDFSGFCTRLAALFLCGLVSVLSACDGGLEPAEKPLISGMITFKGGNSSWPPADSVREVRIVAFRVYPPQDIISEVLNERAYFTQQSLPLFGDTASYTIELPNPAPDHIAAVVAALRYGDNIMADWRVIGLYSTSGDNSTPSPLNLVDQPSNRNINITVDFDNLPPQPF